MASEKETEKSFSPVFFGGGDFFITLSEDPRASLCVEKSGGDRDSD